MNSGEFMTLKKVGGGGGVKDDLSYHPLNYANNNDDVSIKSGMTAEELQDYHWDCSDWARPSQNPLPNIVGVSTGEVPDGSSFHSDEFNGGSSKTNRGGVDDHHPSFDYFCGSFSKPLPVSKILFDSDLDDSNPAKVEEEDERSRLLTRNISDLGTESSDASFFTPHAKRYESHLNDYLPRYASESETEDDNEQQQQQQQSRKLLRHPNTEEECLLTYREKRSNFLPKSSSPPSNFLHSSSINNFDEHSSTNNGVSPPSPHINGGRPPPSDMKKDSNWRLLKNNNQPTTTTKIRLAEANRFSFPPDDDDEGVSLFDGSFSDAENVVCEFEDSEVNSEFENDK